MRDTFRWRLQSRKAGVIALAIAVAAIAGTIAWSQTQAATKTVIGFVDLDRVADEYLRPVLDEPLRQETARLQAEFDQKSKGMAEQAKQDLFSEYQQQLDKKKQELVNARLPKLKDAIGRVGERLGLDVVLDKNLVIWGGKDITSEVLLELGVKVAPSGGK